LAVHLRLVQLLQPFQVAALLVELALLSLGAARLWALHPTLPEWLVGLVLQLQVPGQYSALLVL
jgi:hypothetical protein